MPPELGDLGCPDRWFAAPSPMAMVRVGAWGISALGGGSSVRRGDASLESRAAGRQWAVLAGGGEKKK